MYKVIDAAFNINLFIHKTQY